MSMKKQVILVRTRPKDDNITAHTHAWSEGVRQLFQESGWTVTDCSMEKATRESVEAALQAQPGSLFVFYGHGQVDHLEGQDNDAVCDLKNADLLGKRRVYVMARHSVTELGEAAVEKHDALVYLGYAGFVHGHWGNRKDKEYGGAMYALGECVNSGLRAWLGKPASTAEEIKRKMKKAYEYWIDYYMEIDDIDYLVATRFASVLRHNREALDVLGNKQTRLLD
uniref:Caspase domain-containing protein n=1 Tax=Candidatus Kentrum sp. FW TaxID=2126338 RepID=A0A450T083_9GAMM|nr:MAG: hypothetical protein BECKFW1821A_GA0114235_10939 [Candidatus Kentron sp. FW]